MNSDNKVLLVGVSHDMTPTGVVKKHLNNRGLSKHKGVVPVGKSLMGGPSLYLFKKRVLPHITNGSVLLLEGFSRPEVLTADDPDYATALGNIYPLLSEANKLPAVAGRDPRWSADTKKILRTTEDAKALTKFCTEAIDLLNLPETTAEAIDMVLNQTYQYKLARRPPQSVVSTARQVKKEWEAFNRSYISEAKKLCAACGECFLIAGGAHCLAIHQETNWRIEMLLDENIPPEWFLRGALNSGVFSESIVYPKKSRPR